jgi:hypothetical protein
VQTINDCTPYCAAGHFHSYPVLVVFFGSAPYRGSQRYSEVTLIYTGSRPPHAAQTSTGQLRPPYSR